MDERMERLYLTNYKQMYGMPVSTEEERELEDAAAKTGFLERWDASF